MSQSSAPSTTRPAALVVAVLGTALFALAFVAIGVGSLVQRHGRFSTGVGTMLLVYGLFVALAAWAGWRASPLSRGGMVTAAIIHALVGWSTARAGQPWAWAVVALAVVTIIAAVSPATTRALLADETTEPTR